MIYNVTPVNDLIEHDEDEDCVCGPRTELESGHIILVHNSLDNREAGE